MQKKPVLTVSISLLIILIMFLFANPQKFIQKLSQFTIPTLILLVTLFVCDLIIRAIRWWFLLHSQDHYLPFRALLYPTFASSFVNIILPGRLGELIRLYSLKDEYNVTYSKGLSVIVVEQVINMMGLVIACTIALALIYFNEIGLKYELLNQFVPFALLGLLVMIVAILFLFIIDPNKFIPLFFFLPEKLKSKAINLIHTFAFGLKTIKTKFYIFWVALFFSILIWLLEGIMIWLIALTILSPHFEIQIALFASTLANFNFLFPLLPGAVGLYDGTLALVLSLSAHYNPKNGGAFTVALIDRGIKTLILAVLGGFSLDRLGSITVNILQKKTKDVQDIEDVKRKFAD